MSVVNGYTRIQEAAQELAQISRALEQIGDRVRHAERELERAQDHQREVEGAVRAATQALRDLIDGKTVNAPIAYTRDQRDAVRHYVSGFREKDDARPAPL